MQMLMIFKSRVSLVSLSTSITRTRTRHWSTRGSLVQKHRLWLEQCTISLWRWLMVRPRRSMKPRFWRKPGRILSSWRVSTTFTMFNLMPELSVGSLCALKPRDKSSRLTKITS